MPATYCSCTIAGAHVEMAPSFSRPGHYECMGCGAPEEVVFMTQDAMQEQYTRTGAGFGKIPDQLLQHATLIDDEPGVGPRITPFKEPSIELAKGSGRSLKELEDMGKEIRGG